MHCWRHCCADGKDQCKQETAVVIILLLHKPQQSVWWWRVQRLKLVNQGSRALLSIMYSDSKCCSRSPNAGNGSAKHNKVLVLVVAEIILPQRVLVPR
ncbi:hypothetical protein E2C01_102527 [Portunus trituberculatus]|uniref:Uncharacterized protein n=1 Tax=Portunus trituberculatus TaxID=210409 RepID=A0A5B7KDJ7_PORTR|nr:hypothetical protein [Portunus trituberculatus]